MVIIRVGVLALIKNDSDQVLMLLRKNGQFKGMWSLPGGKVELFETLENTIVREMEEELGVVVEPEKLLYIIEDVDTEKTTHWIMPVYQTKIVGGEPQNIEEDEHEDMQWFNINEIPQNVSTISRQAIERM